MSFRKNGFTFLNKIDDWSIVSIPSSVSFNEPPKNIENESPQQIPKIRKAVVIQPQLNNDPKSLLSNNLSESLTPAFPLSTVNFFSNIDSSYIGHLTSKWKIISDNRNTNILPIDLFLTRASEVYQLKDISQSDAYHLLSLVCFCSIPGWFSFENFLILSANFGEKNALLPKLISLLQSNQRTGNWIRFKFKDNPHPKSNTRVYFSLGASYGFVVIKPDGNKILVHNDFDTPFFSDFLIDDKGNRYSSWDSIINDS